MWCNRHGLSGKELVVVDGTKIRAARSRQHIYTGKATEKALVRIEKKICEYMDEREKNDTAEAWEIKVSIANIEAALEYLNRKKELLEGGLEQIKANGGREISTIDPDAQFMHTGGDGPALDARYNVQTVVDSKNKLIVDLDVSTCPDDKGALPKMTESAKEIFGGSAIAVVADTGYYDGGAIARCESAGTSCVACRKWRISSMRLSKNLTEAILGTTQKMIVIFARKESLCRLNILKK